MAQEDPVLLGVCLIGLLSGLSVLRFRAKHKSYGGNNTQTQVKAAAASAKDQHKDERIIQLKLGEGSSIDGDILARVLLRFDGITGHEYDGAVVSIRGSTPADEITNSFAKIGTQFQLVGPPEVQLSVQGMMCQNNCANSVQRLLRSLPDVSDAHVYFASKMAIVRGQHLNSDYLIQQINSIGFEASAIESIGVKRQKRNSNQSKFGLKQKHACLRKVATQEEVEQAFIGVKKHYKEQQLQKYSRYKNWKQSCYMEVHPTWNPQPPINDKLCEAMSGLLQKGKAAFAEWYKDLHGLADVEVITLNSFITKYIPCPGKDEFGKHVDGAKIDGSLILALPTDDPHDWPGIRIWDGPKGADGNRPEHLYKLNPGDICCMDSLIWHHGLPITKGTRYVCVCFYKCRWKQVKH